MTADNENENNTGFDPKRRLCPDGTCVGVISPDGKCSVCGSTGADLAADEAFVDSAADHDLPDEAAAPLAGDAFDPNRRLCSDEACIGIIGTDGRCNVCGKAA